MTVKDVFVCIDITEVLDYIEQTKKESYPRISYYISYEQMIHAPVIDSDCIFGMDYYGEDSTGYPIYDLYIWFNESFFDLDDTIVEIANYDVTALIMDGISTSVIAAEILYYLAKEEITS